MQACVKMYAAVKQQMPALDVFINVFSSSVGEPRLASSPLWSPTRGGGVTPRLAPTEVRRRRGHQKKKKKQKKGTQK